MTSGFLWPAMHGGPQQDICGLTFGQVVGDRLRPVPPDEGPPSTHDEVATAFRAYLQAMLDGDTGALDNLLADGCTLTHVTGYMQPKDEWLSQMRADQFLYHRVKEESMAVEVEGNTARVSGRFITDATMYGTRANWRLQMTMDYAHEDDTWTAVRSAATTW